MVMLSDPSSSSTPSLALSSITDSFWAEETLNGGDWDTPKSTAAPTLYGRTKETLQIIEAFDRVITVTPEDDDDARLTTIVVHGESGSGKTCLVDLLREPACDRNGYFCSGKFFQEDAVAEPYSALLAAFSDLCEVMEQSDDFIKRRVQIQQALGPDAAFLCHLVSGLSAFCDLQEEESEPQTAANSNDALFARFKTACKSFLKAAATKEHPVVLFLDDIQWADQGSRDLIQALLLQTDDLQHLCLVLAYREEDKDGVLESGILTNQYPHGNNFVDILLGNLKQSAVHALVTELVGCSEHTSTPKDEELSALVLTKTNGNPFHVLQFVTLVMQEGFIRVDEDDGTAHFDIDTLQTSFMVSESLADLLARKMQRLTRNVREALRVAAVMGFSFDPGILQDIIWSMICEEQAVKRKTREDAESSCQTIISMALKAAAKEGFIEKVRSQGGFQFSHDKLQAGFLQELDDAQVKDIHWSVGQIYLYSYQEEKDSVFHAAAHMNSAYGGVREIDAIELAKLNLEAALLCEQKCAFSRAVSFLDMGCDLIDESVRWTDYFDLSFRLYQQKAQVQLILGAWEDCESTLKILQHYANTLELRMNIYMILLDLRFALNQVVDGIALGRAALAELGEKIPTRGIVLALVAKFLKVRKLINKTPTDDLLSWPEMDDEIDSKKIRILYTLNLFALMANELELSAYFALLSVERTMDARAVSPYSPPGFTLYGLLEAQFSKYDRAVEIAHLAIKLHDHQPSNNLIAGGATYFHCISQLLHHRHSLPSYLSVTEEKCSAAFEAGDCGIAMFGLANTLIFRISCGMSLVECCRKAEELFQRVCDFGQSTSDVSRWFLPPHQMCLKLMDPDTPHEDQGWGEYATMTGEIMSEEEFLTYCHVNNQSVLTLAIGICKILLLYSFGFHEAAVMIANDMYQVAKVSFVHFTDTQWRQFAVLSHYELYRQTKRRKHLRLASKFERMIRKKSASKGNPNTVGVLALFDAERLSARRWHKKKGPVDEIVEAYERVIELARERKHIHHEAIATERVAKFLCEMGQKHHADGYATRAYALYRDNWGGVAKANHLHQELALGGGGDEDKNESVVRGFVGVHVGNMDESLEGTL